MTVIPTKKRLLELCRAVETVLAQPADRPAWPPDLARRIVDAELYLLEQEQKRFEEGKSDAGA